jgi:hypothetical protein
MKIKSVQIGEFLKSLSDEEFNFLKLTMNVREGIEGLMTKYGMTKEDICQNFLIKEEGYENFVKGNYAYTISHMATINSLFMKFEQEKLAKRVPFQVPNENPE